MKAGLTEILCVIDKSGSMAPRAGDVVGGFNRFLADQKACPGEARITMTLFDTLCAILYSNKPLQEAPDLTYYDYVPGGCTALLDAIGRTITEAGAAFAARPEAERPEKVVVLIMTDGQENSSKEHTWEAIRAMIERQQNEWHWQFVFLGANQDSFAEGAKIGIKVETTANFVATPQGFARAYGAVGQTLCAYRQNKADSMALGAKMYE